jgi:Mg-chelatase subunit ChlD
MQTDAELVATRWRLVLGKYSEQQLSGGLGEGHERMDRALDFLYGREYHGRGVRHGGGQGQGDGHSAPPGPDDDPTGTLDPTQLAVPEWLAEVRELFPQETVEVIEKHALDRYGLTELVTDPETLGRLEPSMDLLKIVLSFRGQMQGRVLDEARRLIRKVVEDIRRRLETLVRNALMGRLNRFRHSPLKVAQNLDWRGTIRKNLKHYDPKRSLLVVQDLLFFARVDRKIPWTVVLCIDQSGSMTSSVIHSAVMAGILAGLPMLRVKLVVFDTSIVDLSDRVDDPVEVLMSVQLGGGTDIGQAMTYCEQLIDDPHRTVVVLVSDFCEGASPVQLLAACKRLREAGVTLLGLAALDDKAAPAYDRQMAERLAALGMEIAALTPERLALWLAKKIS